MTPETKEMLGLLMGHLLRIEHAVVRLADAVEHIQYGNALAGMLSDGPIPADGPGDQPPPF